MNATASRGMALVAVAALVTACQVDGAAPDSDGAPSFAEVTQAMSVCADGPTVYGIDVSRFQGDIDWQQVADAGVVYAWIQISRSVTDLDAKFDDNWRRAKEVGILRGAYQRFQPGQDVRRQAEIFLERHGPFQPGDLPPMLDVEDSNGLSGPDIAAAVQQWMDLVEPALGVTPLIYTGFYFWRDEVGGPDFSRHPLWIPNYSSDCPLVPPTWTDWTLHQYSDEAVLPGVTVNTVDVNRFNGTMEDLRALGRAAVCGDGLCSGDETAVSCLDDCPPCQVIAAGGDVVDDASACFTAGGDPQLIRHEAAGHGGGLQWTLATDAAAPANHGLWQLFFAEAGRYRLDVHTPAPHSQSRQAVYQIAHDGGATAVEVDQTAVDGWSFVAELDFAAGGGQAIRVDDNTGEPRSANAQIVFDAVRLTRLGDANDPPPGDGGAGDDPGDGAPNGDSGGVAGGVAGCAIAPRPDGGALLLALALLALARRSRGRQ